MRILRRYTSIKTSSRRAKDLDKLQTRRYSSPYSVWDCSIYLGNVPVEGCVVAATWPLPVQSIPSSQSCQEAFGSCRKSLRHCLSRLISFQYSMFGKPFELGLPHVRCAPRLRCHMSIPLVVSGHTLWHKPALATEIIGGTGKEEIQFLSIPLPSTIQACKEDPLQSRCWQ